MTSGKNSADIRRDLARWIAYQRERAYFEDGNRAELRQAIEAWQSRGSPGATTVAEQDAAIAHLAELFPEAVTFRGTLPDLQELVSRSRPRGRPFIYDRAAWPKARAGAVAKIRRRAPGRNHPSRARIAAELGIAERTVFNYDRASGLVPPCRPK